MKSNLVMPHKETKKEYELRMNLIKAMLKEGKRVLGLYGIDLKESRVS